MKNGCIVFKLSDNLHKKFLRFYEGSKQEKNPPYSIMQAKTYDCVITLYESGKVMFQGIGADIEASIWMDAERRLNNRIISIDGKEKKINKQEDTNFFINDSSIGSDETGCGDVFGPVVVCATFVSKENIAFMKELGVKDSKKITDDKIKEMAPQIIEKIPYVCTVLDNKTYNDNYQNMNMVKLKCILHNKALCSLVTKYKPNYKYAVVDEFVNGKKYYEYLSEAQNVLKGISFYTKGESKCMAVAAASIIARYVFLKEMNKLDNIVGFHLQKGASNIVDEQIEKLVNTYGKQILYTIGKVNFKNIQKVL